LLEDPLSKGEDPFSKGEDTFSAKLSRRSVCKLAITATLLAKGRKLRGIASALTMHRSSERMTTMTSRPHVAVIGAGAFGGWSALHLQRSGARVTLLDAWGPGNSRASSGGETRVIRGAYGPDQPYSKLAARAIELWKENQIRWKRKFFFPIGVLWMAEADNKFEAGSLPVLTDAGIPFEQITARDLARRWPQINFDRVEWGIFEPESGYLLARASAQAVVEEFIAGGGGYRQVAVDVACTCGQTNLDSGSWKTLPLSDGSTLSADRYVFACGPWLGTLFPQTVGKHFVSTRQDVFFFGTPRDDARYNEGNIPVWADHGAHFMYGIPGNQGRGFKLADDTRGPQFDPTTGERLVGEGSLAEARRYLAYRFPGMKDAPLVETRVCQYENTSDHNFIVDRLPSNPNVWIVGGGSGHGFKHGPALGEMVANLILRDASPDPFYRVARFTS
jgi:sarcosine oxidase